MCNARESLRRNTSEPARDRTKTLPGRSFRQMRPQGMFSAARLSLDLSRPGPIPGPAPVRPVNSRRGKQQLLTLLELISEYHCDAGIA